MDPALPPAPYDPPETDDPELTQLLSRLNPPRAPRPVDLPTTDGDLAARYHAGARALPVGVKTPPPEAPVQLLCTAEMPIVQAPRAQFESPARVAPRQRDPRRDAPTVEIPIVPPTRKAPRIVVAVILGIAFVIGATALALSVRPSHTAVIAVATEATATATSPDRSASASATPTPVPSAPDVASGTIDPPNMSPPLDEAKPPKDTPKRVTPPTPRSTPRDAPQRVSPSNSARTSNPMIQAPL
jgi:hypothetical protein